MSAVIGALRVNLGMNSAAFNKGVDEASRRLAGMQKKFDAIGAGFTRAGKRLSIGITAPIAALATASVAAQKKQEQAIAAVDAALASMGNTAGFTSKQLQGIASGLQANSLYGDEEILSKVTANLLTFGNVSGDVFERAQQAAVDLSARLGQDLQSSTIMLGKALNDPVTGVTALTRVGVSLTEQQKEQIKTMAKAGDVAGAQKIILGELERQYKGQAKALAETDSGKLTQAMNSLGDASEKIGAVLLPVLGDLAEIAIKLADRFSALSPSTQKFIVIAGGVAAALGPVAIAIGGVVSALGLMLPALGLLLSPIGAVVAAVAGLAAGAYYLYTRWDELTAKFPIITEVIDAVKARFDALTGVITGFADKAGEQLKLATKGISALFHGDWATAFEAGKQVISNIATGIGPILAGAGKAIIENTPIVRGAMLVLGVDSVEALYEKLREAVAKVPEFVGDLADAIGAAMRGLTDRMLEFGGQVVQGFIQGFKDKIASAKAAVTGFGDDVAGWFKAKLGINSPSRVFAQLSGFIVDGFVQGFTARVGAAKGAVTGFADAVSEWFKATLEINSPSRVFARHGEALVDGLIDGIDSNQGRAVTAASGLGTAIGDAARDALERSVQSFGTILSQADLSQGFSGLFGDLKSQGADAFQSLLGAAFDGGGLRVIGEGMKTAFSGVASGLGSLFAGGGLGAFGSVISSAVPILGAVQAISGLIKSFSSTTVTGQGYDLGVENGSVTGGTFKKLKKTSFWGLFSRNVTTRGALPDDLAASLQSSLDGVKAQVVDVFSRLGVEVGDAAIDGVSLGLTRIDTRKLSESEVQAKIADLFTRYGDDLAAAVADVSLNAAVQLANATDILKTAGQGFYGSIASMASAAGDLLDRVGGQDSLASKVATFADTFLSKTEKLAVLQDAVGQTFDSLGLSIPKTNDEFKRLVLTQDLMTKSGRAAYAALLDIAPVFDTMTGLVSELATPSALQERFNLSGDYATAFDERLAQVAEARGFAVNHDLTSGRVSVAAGSGKDAAQLLVRMVTILENWDINGLEVIT